jgi:hypothetical protein
VLLVTLALSLAAAAAAQSDPFLELGIPAASPYEDPARKAAKAAPPPKPVHPLEAALEGRLAADLAEILAARDALAEVRDYARSRPLAFPPARVERAELFDEWRDEAGRAWSRAADILLALDAQGARYAAAPALSTPRARAAACSALALSFTARARFMRDFSAYAANDAALAFRRRRPGPASRPGRTPPWRAAAAARCRRAGLVRAAR